MGCRLISESCLSAKEDITSPVQQGTYQLTPSGQLIIFGRNAQTRYGYSRVLQLTSQEQDCLGKMQIGSTVRFRQK